MSLRPPSWRAVLVALSILGALLAALAGYGWRWAKGGRAFARLDSFAEFRRLVVPVLDRRCGSCHGVPGPDYRKMESEPDQSVLLRWATDQGGRILSAEQERVAYERCTQERRTQNRRLRLIDPEAVEASLLVRAPLATAYSGYWRHPEVFATPEDPDYRALVEWLALEARGAKAAPLAPTEQMFADQVAPILARKTCLSANCHGELAFNDLKLDAGLPHLKARFSPEIHRANRLAMLGKVTRLVHLSGDVEQSKQLLKSIPLDEGGVVHKGGNAFLAKDDPDYRVLERWLEAEASDARRRTGARLGELRGLVFVRRPRGRPERVFEDLDFLPGARLLWRKADGTELDLTAGLERGAGIDVRAPAVSYDARRVVFALRRAREEPFNLWEIDLDSRVPRPLTFSADPRVHYLDPTYVPDPDDPAGDDLARVALVFVSNREGGSCPSSPAGRLGEAEGGSRSVVLDDQLTDRPRTFDGHVVRFVRGTNVGSTRRIRRQEEGQLLLDVPLERPVDSTTHFVIEVEPRVVPCFDAYRMRLAPPGREAEAFGTTLTRMTYSPSQVRRPTLRSSGEVIFTSLRTGVQGDRPFFNGALFRTHVDGSNFHTQNGNRSGIEILTDDRELPSGLEVRIGRDPDSFWGGTLIVSDHQFGPTIEDANPLDDLDHPYRAEAPVSSEARFVPGWIAVDPAVLWRGVSPGGAYRDPHPLPDGSIVVAWAKGPLDLADRGADPDFDIVRLVPTPSWQAREGFAAGTFRRETLVGGPESELWPRPVAARLKEPVLKVLQRDEPLFGPPSVVRGFAGYPEGTPAVLHVADLPLLDAFFEQIAPVGPRHIALPSCPICGRLTPEDEQIHYVRLVSWRDGRRGVIAELPLEPDGSFFAAVPSGIAFDIQSLNGRRMALRSPHRWLYALPGEKHTLSIPRRLFPQTCAGCHGGLTGKPADTLRRPDAMTSASHTLANWSALTSGSRRPANWPDARPLTPREIDFEKDVRPILDAQCRGCHGGGRPAAGLDLGGPRAFEALRRHIADGEVLAVRSYLIEKLIGRELRAPRALTGEHPHPSRMPLSEEQLRTLVRWIDLGAAPGRGRL